MQLSGRTVTVMVVAMAAILVGYTIYSSSSVPGCATGHIPASFTVDGKAFQFTYTATCQPGRETGLMNRRVSNSTTMLFAFPSFGQWSFWMYDTNTSLDMIWVNGTSGRVVYLVTSAQPCYDSGACAVYTPTAAADYVIEARAGFAYTYGIHVGTAIELG